MRFKQAIAIDHIMMIGEEKYTELIERTQASFKADQPMFPPPMGQDLRQAVRKRRQTQGLRPLVNELLRYRIPVWQAAATVAAVFFIVLLSLGRQEQQAPTVYVYLTDTIYKMIPAPVVEPDWTDTVARVLPTSLLDASLHQERPLSNSSMGFIYSSGEQALAAVIDTGMLSVHDSATLPSQDFMIHRPIRSPDDPFTPSADSFSYVY